MRRYNAHKFRVDESPDGALVFFSEVEGLLLSNQRLRKELDHYKRLAESAGILIEREYEIRPNIIYLSEYEQYNSILREREGKK